MHGLFDAVRGFEDKLSRRSLGHTTIDPKLARELVATTQRLLGTLDETTPERTRRLVQAAVRYLVVEDDADGDLDSILGLDDDAEVLNAVLVQLGRAAWTVPIP